MGKFPVSTRQREKAYIYLNRLLLMLKKLDLSDEYDQSISGRGSGWRDWTVKYWPIRKEGWK